MGSSNLHITIIGAGISGLATAHWLQREGYDLTVLEAGPEPGGTMESRLEGGFLVDCGPNSGLYTTPLIGTLVEAAGLQDDLVYANEAGGRRYILRNGELHPLPTGPWAFFKSGLFSGRAKWRLFAEPFIGRSEDGYYQSISEFVRRRLGQEFLDYAIKPFVSGVFAGDPDTLSVKSAFPKLYRLEEVHGGLIKGMIKGAKERKARAETSKQHARMFSFRKGMQSFPKALAMRLGDRMHYGSEVRTVSRFGNRWRVTYQCGEETREIDSIAVLSAVPAYRAAPIFGELDGNLASHLNEIYYPPVQVLQVGFRREDVGRPLDGFGFLIPEKEKKSFLGAIWSSTLFPGRAPDGMAAFTLFIGGAMSPWFFKQGADRIIETVLSEFKEIMQIRENPVFLKEKMWLNAIPQYTIGYIEHERYFDKFEVDHPGLFLGGNYRGGISVGDCILQSDAVYRKIKLFAGGRSD